LFCVEVERKQRIQHFDWRNRRLVVALQFVELRCLRPSLLDYADRAVFLAPARREKRAAHFDSDVRVISDGALALPLPDVSGEENRGGSAGQTSEPTGAEAQYPGAELRCPAELIERDAEKKCSEEPAAKADAGIETDRCSSVPRSSDSNDT